MKAMGWEAVIGLEIHAQLACKSKIFSSSSTEYGAEQNTQASLIDLGYPGVLPVLNKEAVIMAIKFGLAIMHALQNTQSLQEKTIFIQIYLKAIKLVNMNCQSYLRVT